MGQARTAGTLQWLVQWLRSITSDHTRIHIIGKHVDRKYSDALVVENDSTDMGVLVFGITTRSKHQVEILKVEIDFPATMQLTDPKKMGFFQGEESGDPNLPVRVSCGHRLKIRPRLISVFALIAQFPPHVRKITARISVEARLIRDIREGVETTGSIQKTRKTTSIVLSNERSLRIEIPGEHTLTTSQPFLIMCGLHANGYGLHQPLSNKHDSPSEAPNFLNTY